MTLPRFVPIIPAILRPIVTVTMGLLLCACSTVDYYAHVAKGQSELVMSRRDVREVLRDPSTDAEIRKRLQLHQLREAQPFLCGLERVRDAALFHLADPALLSLCRLRGLSRLFFQGQGQG
jgi:type III secretory pathway component EscU